MRRLGPPAVAQIAAALVALSLSGVPRVASLHAPVKRHVCRCAHGPGEHRCGCVVCRRAALVAEASGAHLPPCHREAARKRLADERSLPGAPSVDGTCGDGAQPPVTAAGIEPFLPPALPALRLALADPERGQGVESALKRAVEPETPPPRAA